jgi:hypothetical protein
LRAERSLSNFDSGSGAPGDPAQSLYSSLATPMLPDWLPVALWGIFVAATILGLVGIAGLWLWWDAAGSFLAASWPKMVIEIVQWLSLVVAAGSAYANATDKPDWFPTTIWGIFCVGAWKTVHWLAEKRIKEEDQTIKEQLDRANQLAVQLTGLLGALRGAVREKVKRLCKEVRRQLSKPGIASVRNALTPEPHLQDLLNSLAVFFQSQLPEPDARASNFRIGVYIERGEVMTPVHGVELKNPGYNPFTSFESHKDRFRLGPENALPTEAVICVRQKGLAIVEDCEASAKVGKFFFFNDSQASYLRSMVAYFLGQVSDEHGKMARAALVADTDVAGFFKEKDRASLAFCLLEFGMRLRLEMSLLALLLEREQES